MRFEVTNKYNYSFWLVQNFDSVVLFSLNVKKLSHSSAPAISNNCILEVISVYQIHTGLNDMTKQKCQGLHHEGDNAVSMSENEGSKKDHQVPEKLNQPGKNGYLHSYTVLSTSTLLGFFRQVFIKPYQGFLVITVIENIDSCRTCKCKSGFIILTKNLFS